MLFSSGCLHDCPPPSQTRRPKEGGPPWSDPRKVVLLGLTRGSQTSFPFAEGSVQDVNLSNTYSYYMIQGLQPGTEYTVTINPIFGDVEGPVVRGKATTGECPAGGVGASPSRRGWGSGCAGVICGPYPACHLVQKAVWVITVLGSHF